MPVVKVQTTKEARKSAKKAAHKAEKRERKAAKADKAAAKALVSAHALGSRAGHLSTDDISLHVAPAQLCFRARDATHSFAICRFRLRFLRSLPRRKKAAFCRAWPTP